MGYFSFSWFWTFLLIFTSKTINYTNCGFILISYWVLKCLFNYLNLSFI